MKKFLIAGAFLMAVAGVAWMWRAQASDSQPSQSELSQLSRDEITLNAITDQSDMIVTGRCTGLRTEWVQDGRVLVTLASIEVADTLKGGEVESLTVSLPGGVDANRRIPVAMTYPDAARIQLNEEVVLFLSNDDLAAGAYAVTGSQLGKLSIVEGEDGSRLVSRDNIGPKVQAAPGIVRGSRAFTPEAAFKQKVRGYVN